MINESHIGQRVIYEEAAIHPYGKFDGIRHDDMVEVIRLDRVQSKASLPLGLTEHIYVRVKVNGHAMGWTFHACEFYPVNGEIDTSFFD